MPTFLHHKLNLKFKNLPVAIKLCIFSLSGFRFLSEEKHQRGRQISFSHRSIKMAAEGELI